MFYAIKATWQVTKTWTVEAESMEQAIEIAENGLAPCDSLENAEYVDDTFHVDECEQF